MTEDMYRDHLELIDKTEEQLKIAIKLYTECEKLGLVDEKRLFQLLNIKYDLTEMWHIVKSHYVELKHDNSGYYDQELDDELEEEKAREEDENNNNI